MNGNSGTSFTLPSGATVTVQSNGAFTYTPAANFSGNDSFDYTISDVNGATSTATVTMMIVR